MMNSLSTICVGSVILPYLQRAVKPMTGHVGDVPAHTRVGDRQWMRLNLRIVALAVYSFGLELM